MSFPWDPISEHFSHAGDTHTILVVGSGYGGGVAASRLARAGQSVTVLERGYEFAPGTYPRDLKNGLSEFRVTLGESGRKFGKVGGLYDLHVGKDMSVFVGCGLGGTSLINANVAIEPDPRIYATWPAPYSDDPAALAPYYDLAREMLGSTPYPEGRSKAKLDALERIADGLGKPMIRPDINVSFEDGYNTAGVFQAACTDCGDCVSGCNYGAKNTVLMNYLPDAKAHGAHLYCGAEVRSITRTDKDRWAVTVWEHDPEADEQKAKKPKERILTADIVILAAGTLGSTEILKRSAPNLAMSDMLGQRFSGNGDIYAFGYNANIPTEDGTAREPIYGVGAGPHEVAHGLTPDHPGHKPGPCIIGAIDMRSANAPLEDGVLIEKGVMPGALGPIYAAGFPVHDALDGDLFRFGDAAVRLDDARRLGEAFQKSPLDFPQTVYDGPVSRTMPFLVMSHDGADGEMVFENDYLSVHWNNAGDNPAIRNDNEIIRHAAVLIDSEFLTMPLWQDAFGKKLVSVHPLGGCVMGTTAEDGVVNADCQVFDRSGSVHSGLFVCDGSVIPGSVGVNPHLTITAVAERAVATLAMKRKWSIDYAPRPHPDTLPAPSIPAAKTDYAALIDQGRGALVALRTAIDAHAWELAENLIRGFWRSFVALIPERLRNLSGYRVPSADDVVGIVGGPVALPAIVRPIVVQFLEILDPIYEAVAKSDYVGAFAILEEAFGDFSPAAKFEERMTGHITTAGVLDTDPTPPGEAFTAYRGLAENAELCATIESDSIRAAMTPPDGFATISKGTLTSEALGGTFDFSGKFRFLMPDPSDVERWEMTYVGTLSSAEDDALNGYEFSGFKTLQRRAGSHWWRDVTELSVEITRQGDPVARGLLKVSLQEALKQAQDLEVGYKGLPSLTAYLALYDAFKACLSRPGGKFGLPDVFRDAEFRRNGALAALPAANNVLPELKGADLVANLYKLKIASRMGGLVLRSYGGIFSYFQDFPGHEAADGPAPDNLVAPKEFYPEVEPGVYVKLTRYQGGTRGPVMLAGGFGTRASSFATPTVNKNLVQMLVQDGYDVWLFDYRGSGEIEASQSPFTLDDVARKDWPAAIDLVTRITRSDTVQAVVHCIGSMSLFMAILAGEHRVRAIVASQLGPHAITNWFNFAKGDAELAGMMYKGLPKSLWGAVDLMKLDPELSEIAKHGMEVFDPCSPLDENPDKLDQMMNAALWKVPSFAPVPCLSPTCHRINFAFGPSYRHEQLNQATHNAIRDMFGPVSAVPFKHIGQIFAAGRVCDVDGIDTYMPGVGNLSMPIRLIAGARNQEMLPEATLRTLNWLKSSNPDTAGPYSRRVYPDYGHMDCFIGKNASEDIFPDILEWLAHPT